MMFGSSLPQGVCKRTIALLENTEEEIITGQSAETGNIGYTREKQTKQKHDTICVGHHKHK
jgi:hypothetical protein